MSGQRDRWPVVSRAINARMTALAWGQADLMRAANISQPTAQALMKGEAGARRGTTLRRVSVALGWEPDEIERILAGKPAPKPVSSAPSADVRELVDATTAAVEALQAEVARLASEVERLRGGALLPPSSAPPASNATH